jgi:hypothetical protein
MAAAAAAAAAAPVVNRMTDREYKVVQDQLIKGLPVQPVPIRRTPPDLDATPYPKEPFPITGKDEPLELRAVHLVYNSLLGTSRQCLKLTGGILEKMKGPRYFGANPDLHSWAIAVSWMDWVLDFAENNPNYGGAPSMVHVLCMAAATAKARNGLDPVWASYDFVHEGRPDVCTLPSMREAFNVPGCCTKNHDKTALFNHMNAAKHYVEQETLRSADTGAEPIFPTAHFVSGPLADAVEPYRQLVLDLGLPTWTRSGEDFHAFYRALFHLDAERMRESRRRLTNVAKEVIATQKVIMERVDAVAQIKEEMTPAVREKFRAMEARVAQLEAEADANARRVAILMAAVQRLQDLVEDPLAPRAAAAHISKQFNFVLHLICLQWDNQKKIRYADTIVHAEKPAIWTNERCDCGWAMFAGTAAQRTQREEVKYREAITKKLKRLRVKIVCHRSRKCKRGEPKTYEPASKRKQRKQWAKAAKAQREQRAIQHKKKKIDVGALARALGL